MTYFCRFFTQFSLKKTGEFLSEIIVLFLVFLIPLYFSVFFPAYNIFELSKLSVFKILVSGLLFLTVTRLIFGGLEMVSKKYFRRFWFIPIIFIAGLLFNFFFSLRPLQSFFGSYDRQAGYLSYLFYCLFFFLVSLNLAQFSGQRLKIKIRRLLLAAVFSGGLVSLYGILQILGIDFLSWPEDPLLTKRTLSTFGQPNFLASWLLLVIPVTAYISYSSRRFWSRFVYGLVLLAELVCLLATSSRGGILALVLSGGVLVFYLLFFTGLKKRLKIIGVMSLLVAASVGLLAINIILPGRLRAALDFSAGSSAARVNFYQAAANAILVKPIWGYGLENSGEVFITYYQSDWGVHGNVGATTDKAHNLFLDIILAGGFWALFLFTLLYYYFFRLAIKNIRQEKVFDSSGAIALGVLAYLLSLFFSFSIVTGEIYFFLFLAIIVSLNANQNLASEEKVVSLGVSRQGVFKRGGLLILVLVATIWLLAYEVRVMIAENRFNRVHHLIKTNQIEEALRLFPEAERLTPNPINREHYQLFLGDRVSTLYLSLEGREKELAKKSLESLRSRLPLSAYENYFVQAKINSVLGGYQQAAEYFAVVAGRSPFWPKTYIELARLFFYQGDLKRAILNYKTAEAILPIASDSRFNNDHLAVLKSYHQLIFRELGDIYFLAGDYQLAEEYYQAAYRADVSDFTLLKKIADMLYLRHDILGAIRYNLHGQVRSPNDYQWLLALASLYHEASDDDQARSYLKRAQELAPESREVLEFSQQLFNQED